MQSIKVDALYVGQIFMQTMFVSPFAIENAVGVEIVDEQRAVIGNMIDIRRQGQSGQFTTIDSDGFDCMVIRKQKQDIRFLNPGIDAQYRKQTGNRYAQFSNARHRLFFLFYFLGLLGLSGLPVNFQRSIFFITERRDLPRR